MHHQRISASLHQLPFNCPFPSFSCAMAARRCWHRRECARGKRGFSTVSGVHQKIPQIGFVEVEDEVEIGANVAVDRARFGRTRIGKGTKIDNLVQIAHNVEIGPNCLIVAQAGIAGSTRIGRNVILAGQSGVDGHKTVGDNVVVGAKAGVTRDLPSNLFVSGFPAQDHESELKLQATIRKLPAIIRHVKALEERLSEIEKKTTDPGEGR